MTENSSDPTLAGEHASWPDFAIALYERLTGRGAAISYEFHDFELEVPRSTEANAPRATWKMNGRIRVTTEEPG
jgi:hypothetical protein